MTTALKAQGTYPPLSTATTAQNKTDINALLTALASLFQAEGTANNPAYPDFGIIPQQAASQILAEIAAIQAVVTASP